MNHKITCTILALLTVGAMMSSCVAKPPEETVKEWEGKEEFAPSDEMKGSVLELNERYEIYSQNAGLAFSQNQPMGASFFETEAYEDGVKIVGYTGEENIVVIPEEIDGKTVLALGETSFAESEVRAVKVPDCVKAIEKGAFASCEKLSTLALPFVGDGGENAYFGYIFGASSYEEHALKVPASLDMVLLGDAVKRIEENAFAGCKAISCVVFGDSVEYIGEFAFYECKDLVYIPTNSVKTVGAYAFGYCSSLFMAYFYNVEAFELGAFYECNSLRIMGVSFVGGSASENRFIGYLFGSENADYNAYFVPESLYGVIVDGTHEIPDRAFAGCAYIAKFLLADGVESIGVRAFYGCRSIVEIDLPDTLTTIGDDAFFGCDNLKTINFGSSLEKIGAQAFYGCRALSQVEFPDGVTEILPSTFALCRSLKTVDLNKVQKIGKDAFWNCTSLVPVNVQGIEVADGNQSLSGAAKLEE